MVIFMKKLFHILWAILQIVIILYVLVITLFIVNRNSYGYTEIGNYQFSVIHKNNKNVISKAKVGDLLIIEKTHSIKKGNTIYYYSVNDNRYIIQSGIVKEVVGKGEDVLYQIEGDNQLSVVGNRVLGKKANRYSKLGYVIEYLEGKVGFLFFVLLPIMIIFVYHIYQLFIQIRYDEVNDKK